MALFLLPACASVHALDRASPAAFMQPLPQEHNAGTGMKFAPSCFCGAELSSAQQSAQIHSDTSALTHHKYHWYSFTAELLNQCFKHSHL